MISKNLSLIHLIRPNSIANNAQPKGLFMLHGYGSNEMDLFSFVEELPEDLFIISARAPKSLSFGGFSWYDIHFDADDNKFSDNQQAMDSLNLIVNFIDEAVAAYDLDAGNINLLGFSQGAVMSYALAFTFPEKLKNIIALSGYINEDIMPVIQRKELYCHLNFFVSHGIYDSVIPVEWAKKTPNYLSEYAVKHVYKEYPMGHEVNPSCFGDIKQWISENL